ncbi:MAG: hypothetical protein LBL17_03115 [Coxiellaceae bacterium]|jgi:hypothetical protein|nr:hypothetical protein [Coxiellaceae bacterium]
MSKKNHFIGILFFTILNLTQECYALEPLTTTGLVAAVGVLGGGITALALSGSSSDTPRTTGGNETNMQILLNRYVETHLLTLFESVRISTPSLYAAGFVFERPYGEFAWPINIPLVHAYNPDAADALIDHTLFTEFTATIRLTPIRTDSTPLIIQTEAKRYDLTQIERFIVVQNNPWRDTENILLRPHPLVHKNASIVDSTDLGEVQIYTSTVTAYIANINEAFRLLGTDDISTHTSPGYAQNRMVFSGPAFPNIGQTNPANTTIFYTFFTALNTTTIASVPADRQITPNALPLAAITLHILCNRADHDRIKGTIRRLGDQISLGDFLDNLDRDGIPNTITAAIRNFAQGTISAP